MTDAHQNKWKQMKSPTGLERNRSRLEENRTRLEENRGRLEENRSRLEKNLTTLKHFLTNLTGGASADFRSHENNVVKAS